MEQIIESDKNGEVEITFESCPRYGYTKSGKKIKKTVKVKATSPFDTLEVKMIKGTIT